MLLLAARPHHALPHLAARARAHRLHRPLEEGGHLVLVKKTRAVQSSIAAFVLRVEVGALLDQKLGDVAAAGDSRKEQRSKTRLRGRSGVWAYAAEREEEEG